MTRKRWAVVAALTTAGVLLGGGAVALADTPPPTPAPNSGTANHDVCTTRIPQLLTRVDTLTAKINGPATERGSTASLQAREDKARANGRTARADLLAARIADRPQRLTELAQLKSQVQHVQSTDCGS